MPRRAVGLAEVELYPLGNRIVKPKRQIGRLSGDFEPEIHI